MFWSSLNINLMKFSDAITFFCVCLRVSSSLPYRPVFIIISKCPLLMHRMRKQLFQVHQWSSIPLCITHQMQHLAITCHSFSPWEPKFICQGHICVLAAKNVSNPRLGRQDTMYGRMEQSQQGKQLDDFNSWRVKKNPKTQRKKQQKYPPKELTKKTPM